jgi:hypothetical protein
LENSFFDASAAECIRSQHFESVMTIEVAEPRVRSSAKNSISGVRRVIGALEIGAKRQRFTAMRKSAKVSDVPIRLQGVEFRRRGFDAVERGRSSRVGHPQSGDSARDAAVQAASLKLCSAASCWFARIWTDVAQ